MEANISQHTLTFAEGLSTNPSDILCHDNTLSSADGLILADGEYKAVQSPATLFPSVSGELLCVHTLNSAVKHYVFYDNGALNFIGDDESTGVIALPADHTPTEIVAVGNTLIMRSVNSQGKNNPLYYYLWKQSNGYIPLGNSIPEPELEFRLIDGEGAKSSGSAEGLLYEESSEYVRLESTEENGDAFNNLVTGLYAKNCASASKNKEFTRPFFIRYAVELYNGTYTKVSQPIPFFPSVSENSFFMVGYVKVKGSGNNYTAMRCFTKTTELMYQLHSDYSDWKDIVRGVVLFASPQVEIYATSKDCTYTEFGAFGNNGYVSSGIADGVMNDMDDMDEHIFRKDQLTITKTKVGNDEVAEFSGPAWALNVIVVTRNKESYNHIIADRSVRTYHCLQQRSYSDIQADLATTSSFFKLAELGTKPNPYLNGRMIWQSLKGVVKDHVFENLTSQTTLTDGYYDHTLYLPGDMVTFNRRLNIFNSKRSFFDGFKRFIYYDRPIDVAQSVTYRLRYYVDIDTPEGTRTVMSEVTTSSMPQFWFYYPDPRAKKVTVFGKNMATGAEGKLLERELQEHSGLNGAFFLQLPDGSDLSKDHIFEPVSGTEPTVSNDPETLSNHVYQSEVDNPFSFLAEGDTRVGQGSVIGMAGLTTALNQDMYLVATTLVFTTQGIWALSIDSEGQYSGVKPPFSREVCSNPESITMTDNAVYFVSKKGLMRCTGTNESSVVCVSEALSNSEFVEFCQQCRIAYDYKESLLFLYQEGVSKTYIYSMRAHAWTADEHLLTENTGLARTIIDYPDTLLQTTNDSVLSLLHRPNRNDDPNTYDASFTSRPLKLDGMLVPKSIRQMHHLYNIGGTSRLKSLTSGTDAPSLECTMQASDDLLSWHDISSRRGRAYKFFRMHYAFRNLHASDTFAGVTIITQKRNTEKI